ncbi:MAG TPA: 3'-5' exonuclease [Thermoflexales bacterium]|nr:3'-5' exonuclease [Thermoflexales bacterium]HQX09509.1 3'-5' exonuclease [Thermoflexales bacterium]HQY26166.1 3'-5' exonuclease [Thermoflexales bacterium]
MVLFFDTETTGIPLNRNAPVTDLRNWPRMVQLAWLMTDDTGKELSSAEHIIKPDGYLIPRDAARIHGITTERALQTGADLTAVLNAIQPGIVKASALVAHNMAFDEKILGAEFLRSGSKNPLTTKQRRCTLQESTDFCRIPGQYGFKWPSLDQLHRKLFGAPIGGAHSALADTRACARCFFELKRLNVID